ncbi:hypothetical protein vBRpoSV10_226 [Ruegeria phage vB_RpoS-V10]|nr:hypothetical protein vBRpoSV10_226 [Ruegeria phage vB_RpoS-V10]
MQEPDRDPLEIDHPVGATRLRNPLDQQDTESA